jgi:hypothetical protein
MVPPHSKPISGYFNRHIGNSRKDIGKPAGLPWLKVLNKDEGHPSVAGKVFQ